MVRNPGPDQHILRAVTPSNRRRSTVSPSGSASRRDRDDRQARLAQMRRKQQRADRRRALLIWGTGAVLVLAIAGAVTFAILSQRASTPSLADVQTFTVQQGHVETPVTYAQTPPAGGQHNPVWLNCGEYDKPVPNENAVHSLEHGAVWVTYRPDLPKDAVEKLKSEIPDTYMVLSPYPGLPAPVVASAWGKQLRLTGADDSRLEAFIRAYRQGPQTPEPGAACTGGMDPTSSS
jgi:hypothetical protein